MSDTVKLIIEIPKELYENKKGYLTNMDAHMICKAVQNGIPLEDVKAEIEEMPTEKIARCRKAYIFASEFKIKVLEILDNIGKESEGTND